MLRGRFLNHSPIEAIAYMRNRFLKRTKIKQQSSMQINGLDRPVNFDCGPTIVGFQKYKVEV